MSMPQEHMGACPLVDVQLQKCWSILATVTELATQLPCAALMQLDECKTELMTYVTCSRNPPCALHVQINNNFFMRYGYQVRHAMLLYCLSLSAAE